jgi:rhodanese-related sulfurtransferase
MSEDENFTPTESDSEPFDEDWIVPCYHGWQVVANFCDEKTIFVH